jgi:DNA polymerase-1
MAKTLLLIDGDQYLYRGCAAVERDVKWDDENHVLSSNEVEAWEVVEGSLKKTLYHFGDDAEPVVCLSEGVIFRTAIDPTYKGNRKNTRKPLCYSDLKEKLKASWKCVYFDGLEADDVMGILATKPGPDHKIIVARDKDMQGVPGKLWDGVKFYSITEAEADYFHLWQTLCGDAADGYKGCPGVGPKGAEKLLKLMPDIVDPELTHVEWMWGLVVEAYTKAGLTADDALRQARLARILRWSDWDSKKKEPILWTPNTTT